MRRDDHLRPFKCDRCGAERMTWEGFAVHARACAEVERLFRRYGAERRGG